jgi:hypothetical protein
MDWNPKYHRACHLAVSSHLVHSLFAILSLGHFSGVRSDSNLIPLPLFDISAVFSVGAYLGVCIHHSAR